MSDDFEPIPLSPANDGIMANPISPESPEGLHLFISHPRVAELPEEGCITFRFKRGPRTVTEGEGGISRASVDLRLLEICEVEAEEGEESEKKDDPIDKLFAEAEKE